MRIGLVCPYSLTIPGGVTGQVLGLARTLRSMGHAVVVMGPCDGPPPEPGVLPLGNSVPTVANGSVAPIAPDPSCALRTIRALWDEDFDVVHLHEPLVPGPTQTTLMLAPAPMVGTWHAAGGSRAYRVPGVKWLASRLAVRCAVSEDAREMAASALGGTYEVLFNGIELARFAKTPPTPTSEPTIVFFGRHEPRKGLSVLLEAMSHMTDPVRLWVVGDGPESTGLQARHARDTRIEWLGRVSDTELVQRLKGADVVCLPSLRGESFGMVVLEAMAAGTPVVASDIHGYRNVATNGVDAVLVPPGEPVALAEAITRTLTDTTAAEALRAAGLARANELSMENLAERYLELYERARAGVPSASI